MNILKIRKILLIVLSFSILLECIMTILFSLKVVSFIDNIKGNANILKILNDNNAEIEWRKLEFQNDLPSAIGAVILSIFWMFFALPYIFSTNQRIQMRKWPYIVMIVIYVASIGLFLSYVGDIFNSDFGIKWIIDPSGNYEKETNEVNNIANQVWNDDFKSATSLLIIFGIIFEIISTAICVAHLVLIWKQKNSGNQNFSNKISNFDGTMNNEKNIYTFDVKDKNN